MRVSRYIRQHHIGLIALFIALTGTAYAGTQVASHPGDSGAQKAKKKKKVKRGPAGPRGPVGPQGPKGDTGAAGTARAYALVRDGQLVADRSVGILGMSQGCGTPLACDPPPPGGGNIHAYCFRLGFTPNNVQITPLGILNSSANPTAVADFDGQAPAISTPSSVPHCPTGYLSAQADVFANDFESIPHGFFVAFN
jgi:hypothetical protein